MVVDGWYGLHIRRLGPLGILPITLELGLGPFGRFLLRCMQQDELDCVSRVISFSALSSKYASVTASLSMLSSFTNTGGFAGGGAAMVVALEVPTTAASFTFFNSMAARSAKTLAFRATSSRKSSSAKTS